MSSRMRQHIFPRGGGVPGGEAYGRRPALFGALSALAVTAAPHQSAAVHTDGDFRQVGDLAIYLAVVPAAVIRGHPTEHTGRSMHGAVPQGRYVHHLMVALFNARTGARLGEAEVAATVHGIRHTPEARIALEPMTVGGAEAFGGFVTLPARDYYRIEIDVVRAGGNVIRAVFRHQHLQP